LIKKQTPQLNVAKEWKPAVDALTPTLFHESWWLQAATSGSYEQVEVSDGCHVVGRFPYAVWQVPGRRFSGLPTLTHVLGPAICEGEGSANTRFLRRYTITRELIAKLPKLYRFRQRLHAGFQDALSFQAEGFQTGVQFNFEIAPQPQAEAWNKLRNKTRNVIRRAQEDLNVSELTDVDEFLKFYESNLAERGRHKLEAKHEVTAVCAAALQRGAGKILCTRDLQQRLTAATFLASDAKTAYYLMSTRKPDAGNGDISLLIWTAICLCGEKNLKFDFDGIAQEGAVLLYAGFGGQPTPRYIVAKDSKNFKLVAAIKGSLGRFPEENTFDL